MLDIELLVYLHHQTHDNAINGKVSKCSLIDNSTNTLKHTIMTQSYETALAELNNAKLELAAIEAMTDEQVCYIYNVDSKSDKMIEVSEEIEYLEREIEYLAPIDWSADTVTEIFGSYEAMNSYLY